jgi:hypothetical protein
MPLFDDACESIFLSVKIYISLTVMYKERLVKDDVKRSLLHDAHILPQLFSYD